MAERQGHIQEKVSRMMLKEGLLGVKSWRSLNPPEVNSILMKQEATEGLLSTKIQFNNKYLSRGYYVGSVLGARKTKMKSMFPFFYAYSLGSEIFTAVFQKCNWCQYT